MLALFQKQISDVNQVRLSIQNQLRMLHLTGVIHLFVYEPKELRVKLIILP